MRPEAPVELALLDLAVERGRDPPQSWALRLLAAAEPDAAPATLASLAVGERDRRLLGLRERLLGERVELVGRCPACAAEVEVELDTRALAALAAGAGETRAVEVRCAGHRVSARQPTGADLAELEASPVGDAAMWLLRRCVLRATGPDGAPVEPAALPPAVVEALGGRLEAADPLAVLDLALSCAACGHRWQDVFDVAKALGPELRSWVARLLVEVHDLARAYGWREAEILGMPPSRRRAYLELVRGWA